MTERLICPSAATLVLGCRHGVEHVMVCKLVVYKVTLVLRCGQGIQFLEKFLGLRRGWNPFQHFDGD